MAAMKREEVEEIALLARLHLEPAELEQIGQDLGAILDYFGMLAAVDTTDVPAMTHAVLDRPDTPLRADEPAPSLPTHEALAATPKRDGDLIVVPAIIQSRPGAES